MIIIKQNICNIFNKTKNKGFIAIKYDILVCHSCIMMIFHHAKFLGPVQLYIFKSEFHTVLHCLVSKYFSCHIGSEKKPLSNTSNTRNHNGESAKTIWECGWEVPRETFYLLLRPKECNLHTKGPSNSLLDLRYISINATIATIAKTGSAKHTAPQQCHCQPTPYTRHSTTCREVIKDSWFWTIYFNKDWDMFKMCIVCTA